MQTSLEKKSMGNSEKKPTSLSSTRCNVPWCIIGDINAIASVKEKIGEIPYHLNKNLDFLTMIEDCGLTDLGYYGPRHTWSYKRGPCSIVQKRLDKCLVNDKRLTLFPATTVTHLDFVGLDHSPLHMEMHVRQETGKRYFKFPNCLVENDTFMPLIHRVWNMNVNGSAIRIYHQKLKVVTKALSLWSKEQYGGIFQKPKEFEQKVKEAEEKWINTNNPIDRINIQELQAQYVRS